MFIADDTSKGDIASIKAERVEYSIMQFTTRNEWEIERSPPPPPPPPSPPPPPPPPREYFVQYSDKERCLPYYINMRNNESVWTLPAGSDICYTACVDSDNLFFKDAITGIHQL